MFSASHDQSIIRQVDSTIYDAIRHFASDIHLEPQEKLLRVRYRIDGMLYDQSALPATTISHIISRIKVLARMNIAEKRLPQDGKFAKMIDNKFFDFRVSTFPSLYGEKMVIRILDRQGHGLSLNQIGLSQKMLAIINELIRKPTGFFLVTGPTGSGKTTSLYAMLSAVHAPEKNIVTLEDPVEYNLDGVTQGHINPEAGFTFEQGIRSLLRQDPDIIMVGEIRDRQTARIAIEAALTGHLIFSTLHTNDAPSAIMRLMDMKIEPFLINASISGIIAQRLVRMLCSACKQEVSRNAGYAHLCARLGIADDVPLFIAKGCYQCDQRGYRGRIGVFELLVPTPAFRSLIVSQPIFDDIYAQALADGMITLLQDGIGKVKDGLISLDELARIIA